MTINLFLNGTIYTMDAAQPRAQAMAVDTRSGRIVAVGSDDEVRRAGDRYAQVIDLRGKTVLPGFIDAHFHLVMEAYRSHNINATQCASEDEVAELVRQRAAQTPPGKWILGGQWFKDRWPGQRFPTHASLDAAAPQHPVALCSKDGSCCWSIRWPCSAPISAPPRRNHPTVRFCAIATATRPAFCRSRRPPRSSIASSTGTIRY
jgi:predicted amidohydrolase YtcJ